MATIGIDTTLYERTAPQGGNTPLPLGVYTMTAVRVLQKQTNNKTGVYVEVEYDISTPAQYSNRKFWDRFNIINKSESAQRIGRERISELAHACGIHGVLHDDQELLGKTVQARIVEVPSNNPQYPEPKNECKKYYPVGVDADSEDAKVKAKHGNAPVAATPPKQNWGSVGTQAAAPLPQPAVGAATDATPPWKR